MCPWLTQRCPLPEIGTERACYRDMSSFPETKAEKYVNKIKGKKFLQYNRLQLSRIYPKGQRLDSSNYDPLPMWICGSQLVALNFQTPGEGGRLLGCPVPSLSPCPWQTGAGRGSGAGKGSAGTETRVNVLQRAGWSLLRLGIVP